MDPFIIAAIVSAIVIIILSVYILRLSRVKPQVKPRAVAQRDGGPGRVQAVRNQRARMRANAARHQADLDEEPVGHDEVNENEQGGSTQKIELDDKMGAKKRAKLEAKMEKKKQREAEEYMREKKKKMEEEIEAIQKKIDAELEQNTENTNTDTAKYRKIAQEEERLREEAEKKAEEERQKKEQEEYEAMKSAFTVDGEGYEENEEERENLLHEFVDYIKSQKVVVLEDLAGHFKLKTQAVIDRITELQASRQLTGVIDDRGKFIYISHKELEDVAKFIKQRGRVSIAEVAENSNELISLNPVTVL